jgi:predicted GNAT family acetyltransferase
VFDGPDPVGVACGYLDDETGGIYYVATPPEHRGRGVAAAATAWVTNWLLARGARIVILQSSESGFGVYQRLGFDVYDTYQRFEVQADSSHDSASS